MAKSKKSVMWQKAFVITVLVAVVGFIYAAAFLFRWQIVRGEELKTMAIDQSLHTTSLIAMRGTIYDATGTKVLAQSASVWTVALEPKYINSDEDREKIAKGLSEILGLEYEAVLEKTKQNSYFTYLKRKIETEIRDEILTFLEEADISRGVRLIEDYKRYYPYGSLASNVIGFTGTDNNGLGGVELEYDNELTGTKGRMVSAKNAINTDMPFQYEQMISAEDGYSLVLTIDETVQSIVEKYLDEAAEKWEVKNGATAILMEVKTGAILALANSGDYDLNDPFTITDEATVAEIAAITDEDEADAAYSAALQKMWRNKAISDTYIPGSVFKMITGSMALDSGAITENTTFSCAGSYVPYPGTQPIGCWSGSVHGAQTVREGICNSCNPFFMQVGLTMGADTFSKYFEAFGLTARTGIDLPGEGYPIYHSLDVMGPVELATDSFGQGNTVTPIQMITAVSAIANGGYIVQPHIVDRILDSEGNIISTTDTTYKRQVISNEVSSLMTDILMQNATIGTGKNGYVAGYRVCGKTGTSEKVAEYWQNTDPDRQMEYIASFAGFAPAEDPQYALLVFFDEPNRDQASGGLMAAPVFAKIMGEVLPYLGVESQLSASEIEESRVTTPSVLGMTLKQAYSTLENSGLSYSVIGDNSDEDAVVLMQVPSVGSDMPTEGKVVLYTSDTISESDLVEVPDFTGKSVADCNYEASMLGLQILITGANTSGELVAQNQNVASGDKVKPGTVVTITFVDLSGLE